MAVVAVVSFAGQRQCCFGVLDHGTPLAGGGERCGAVDSRRTGIVYLDGVVEMRNGTSVIGLWQHLVGAGGPGFDAGVIVVRRVVSRCEELVERCWELALLV